MSMLAYAGPYKAIGQGIRWVHMRHHALLSVKLPCYNVNIVMCITCTSNL